MQFIVLNAIELNVCSMVKAMMSLYGNVFKSGIMYNIGTVHILCFVRKPILYVATFAELCK